LPRRNPKLDTYRDRRDFSRSREPLGGSGWKKRGNPVFVVQQHAASTMHFDFRLEIDGVLVSWAVPKGPSTNPADKRLAVRTEDHPLEYADFEGTIPAGEYGGGRVIVWDAGPFRNLKAGDDGEAVALGECLENGQIEVWLEGRKIRGGYALVHSRLGGDDANWLLVKMRDAGADARRNPVSTQPESVLSGRTVDEVDDAAPARR
jgi:DNA ligase D-like protein (predicted 3'-phosphoesterase)